MNTLYFLLLSTQHSALSTQKGTQHPHLRSGALSTQHLEMGNGEFSLFLTIAHSNLKNSAIVADRAFNGLNIARAYLGDRAIQSVKVDPSSPNRQITSLRTGRQLTSIVTGRASETPARDRCFLTT